MAGLRFGMRVAVLLSLACSGCYGGSGGGDSSSGSGGTGGGFSGSSSTGGGSTGGGAGGTSAVGPAAVGLSFSVHSPNTPVAGTTCPVITTETIGNPPPTTTEPGVRLTDGFDDVQVACLVALAPSSLVYDVDANVAYGTVKVNLHANVEPAVGYGQGTLSLYTPASDSLASPADQPCEFVIDPAPLQIKPGTMYATFNCPQVADYSNATPTVCQANGVIVLEYCAE